MPSVCPKCNHTFELETAFCPACSAPMNPDAHRIQQERMKKTQALLPMRWHKFLIWFSLPAGLIMNLYQASLILTVLKQFDPAIYAPETLMIRKAMLYLDVFSIILLLPLFALAEWGLIKKRKWGIKSLLGLYLYQALYAIAKAVLFLQLNPDLAVMGNQSTLFQHFITGAELLLMFFLVRTYYRKRNELFS